DEGSWLEIGESISVFVIASALCVFVAGLEMVSEAFVRGIEFDDDDDDEVDKTPSDNGKINGVKTE
ncbi:hypothetical protein KCV02_g18267, partial [Aureobasidium melanogenum]